MTDDPDFADIIQIWGSEAALYEHLQRELVKGLGKDILGPADSLPRIQVKPAWLSRGLMGESHAAADYTPALDDTLAEIGLYPSVLRTRADTRMALVHELIHHWEAMSP